MPKVARSSATKVPKGLVVLRDLAGAEMPHCFCVCLVWPAPRVPRVCILCFIVRDGIVKMCDVIIY